MKRKIFWLLCLCLAAVLLTLPFVPVHFNIGRRYYRTQPHFMKTNDMFYGVRAVGMEHYDLSIPGLQLKVGALKIGSWVFQWSAQELTATNAVK